MKETKERELEAARQKRAKEKEARARAEAELSELRAANRREREEGVRATNLQPRK